MKGFGQPGAEQARKKLDKINSTRPIIKFCPACSTDGTLCGYYETAQCPHRGGPLAELHRIFTEESEDLELR